MPRSILRHLESWFPFLAKNYRLTLLFIPIVAAVIGAIVIGALSKDVDYSSSRLATGIFSGDDGIAQAMIYEYGLLVISVPFGAMLLSDVLTVGTSVSFVQYDLYCKTLIWLFMALPGVVLYSMLSEDYDADHSTEHHTSFAGGAAAKATAVVLFITYINNLVSVFFLNANMIRCVSEEDDFLRPVICVLLSLCNAVCSLMNLAMDLLTPMGTEQSSHFPVLGTAAAVLSYSVYILAALGFASIAAHAYDVLAKRSGTTLHNIEIIFAVTTSIGMFVAARVLSSSSSSVYQTADMTVSVWSRYQVQKTAYIIVLLLFASALRNLQMKRQEQEKNTAERQIAVSKAVSAALTTEKELLSDALYSMVPKRVASELSLGRPVPPQQYEFATLFLSDIVGFTPYARDKTPLVVFNLLDRLYSVMDLCTKRFKTLYKVETIGDAFLVIGGIVDGSSDKDQAELQRLASSVTSTDGDDEDDSQSLPFDPLKRDAEREEIVNEMCQFALLVNECVGVVPMAPTLDDTGGASVKIRIGLHCGPVVTGLAGNVTPRFCVFGDSVNVTSRIETTGESKRVHISEALAEVISTSSFRGLYNLVRRESMVDIKGVGPMQTYFLEPSAKFPFDAMFSDTLTKARQIVQVLLRRQAGLSVDPALEALLENDLPPSLIVTPASRSFNQASDLDQTQPQQTQTETQTETQTQAQTQPQAQMQASGSRPPAPPIAPMSRVWSIGNLAGYSSSSASSAAANTAAAAAAAAAAAEAAAPSHSDQASDPDFDLSIDVVDEPWAGAGARTGAETGAGAGNGTAAIALAKNLTRTAPTKAKFDDKILPTLSEAVCPFSFEELSSPTFDVRRVPANNDVAIGAAILVLFKGVMGVATGRPSLSAVRVKDSTMDYFLTAVALHYHASVHYHNYQHSLCVLQYLAALLVSLARSGAQLPTPEDLFTLLVSAVVHDLDHRGLNNSFHVNSASKLALMFNDRNVLENHHARLAYELLHRDRCNVFEKWDQEKQKRARKLMLFAILATDMECHAELGHDLETRAARRRDDISLSPSPGSGSGSGSASDSGSGSGSGAPFNLSEEKEVMAFCRIFLHTADISNACREPEISSHYARLLAKEFAAQAAREAKLGLPTQPHMTMPIEKGEIGFLTYVAKPYMQAQDRLLQSMAACGFEDLPRLGDAVDRNIAFWQQQQQQQ